MMNHQLNESYIDISESKVYSAYIKAARPRSDQLTVVLMHGAGQADSSRYNGLAQQFADQGVSVVSLDFVGHGKTGGTITDNSLELRTLHALAAIQYWVDDTVPLIVCGFSMSGHTALRVAASLGMRVKHLGLFCPAVYAEGAEAISFGPAFTKLIRTPESWRDSLALKDAANFRGRAAIVIGDNDEIIPNDVISSLKNALEKSAVEVRVEILPGATHQIAKWLTAHESRSQAIVQFLIGEKSFYK